MSPYLLHNGYYLACFVLPHPTDKISFSSKTDKTTGWGVTGGFPENGTKHEETGEVYLQGLFERRHQVTLHVHIDLAGHRFPPSPFLFKLAQLGPLGR